MGVTANFTGLIQRTSDEFIRDNIYMIDKTMLAKALKNIDSKLQDKVFRNMVSASAADVKQIMANLGDVSIESVEAAQQEIITLAAQVV